MDSVSRVKTSSAWNTATPRRKARSASISREQLARAVKSFKKSGGLIETLPPQVAIRQRTAGAHLDTGYEKVIDG